MRPVLVQFVKFGIVGVSNTLLTFAVYTLLLKVFGVWYMAASAIGFVVGATNGFLLNRRWTFADHVGDALTPGALGGRAGLRPALNSALLYLFVDDAGLDELVAQALATVVVDRQHVPRQPRLDVPARAARPLSASQLTNAQRNTRAARARRGSARRGRSAAPRAPAGARAAS